MPLAADGAHAAQSRGRMEAAGCLKPPADDLSGADPRELGGFIVLQCKVDADGIAAGLLESLLIRLALADFKLFYSSGGMLGSCMVTSQRFS